MKIEEKYNRRVVVPTNEDNKLLILDGESISDMVFIADSITESNMSEYFRELTPEEVENLNSKDNEKELI